jgi:transcriptional regulator GlxA family with amidase domain
MPKNLQQDSAKKQDTREAGSKQRSGNDGHGGPVHLLKKINERAFEYYPRLQNFKQHVEKHLAEDWSLETAARLVCMEKKYFSAFFRRKTGVTYKEWLTSMRITRAESIMRTVDDSLMNISCAVGFRDFRTFERAFKKHTAVTPMTFKKLVRPS